MPEIKKTKKYWKPLLLMALALLVLVPQISHAGVITRWLGLEKIANDIIYGFVYVILWIVAKLVWIAGLLLNFSIEIALNKSTPLFGPDGIVEIGWRVSRDVANVFFIFLMLFIGIATILGLQSYGAKRLLVWVIIAALLINFSLLITKAIIDVSNVLAMQFLCTQQMSDGTCNATLLAGKLTDGLATQTTGANIDGTYNTSLNFGQAVIGMVGSIVIMLITAFILFAASILIVIRTIVLVFLAILSPLAFFFMVMPGKFSSYAKKWWDSLFNQCFFLPAYFFFIYLTVTMITSGTWNTVVGPPASFFNLFTNTAATAANSINVAVQFIVVGGFLVGSLIVAKQLGAYGAGAMAALGTKARKAGVGYAGRGARRLGGRAAERIATGEKAEGSRKYGVSAGLAALGRGLQKAPVVGGVALRGAANIAVANRAQIDKQQTALSKFSDKEVKSIAAASTGFRRAAATNELAKRGNLKPEGALTSAGINSSTKIMERYGMDTKKIEKLEYQYAADDARRREIVNEGLNTTQLKDILENEELRNNYFVPKTMKEMNATFKPEHYKTIYESGTDAADKFFDNLRQLGDTTDKVANALEGMNNRLGATWVRGSAAKPILNTYGIS